MKLKSHFFLDSRQRSGILLLVLILMLSWGLYLFKNSFQQKENVSVIELVNYEQRLDSLVQLKEELNKPEIYPFNPNFITDYKGYTLGMNTEEIDKLLRFREKNNWINSAKDFQNVTGVSDSLLAVISPYFKFPEWVTQPATKKRRYSTSVKPNPTKDLNTVDFKALIALEEMNEDIAKRILAYRRKLGGFLDDNQLYDVYGIKASQVRSVKEVYTVLSKPEIVMIDVNKANASDLSTVPYVTFDIARDIIDYRTLHGAITNLDDLLKIDGITAYKLERIKLYLSTNQN